MSNDETSRFAHIRKKYTYHTDKFINKRGYRHYRASTLAKKSTDEIIEMHPILLGAVNAKQADNIHKRSLRSIALYESFVGPLPMHAQEKYDLLKILTAFGPHLVLDHPYHHQRRAISWYLYRYLHNSNKPRKTIKELSDKHLSTLLPSDVADLQYIKFLPLPASRVRTINRHAHRLLSTYNANKYPSNTANELASRLRTLLTTGIPEGYNLKLAGDQYYHGKVFPGERTKGNRWRPISSFHYNLSSPLHYQKRALMNALAKELNT